jgi:hypothetical protein
LGCAQKTGRLADGIAGHGGRAQRPVNVLRGNNCVVRSAAIHFFIAQQSDSAIWL